MDQVKTSKGNNTNGGLMENYAQLILDLVSFCQTLCKQTNKVGERLSKEMMRLTQNRVRLSLLFQNSSNGRHVPFPVSVSFPVQFCNRNYGTLEVAADSAHPAQPALPLAVAQLLAQVCGTLLYNLELSAFIEGQSHRLEFQQHRHLTRRELEVLKLICRGFEPQEIASKLNIAIATVETHKKSIREKFGIHSEHDIALVAYRTNLFSVLE